MELSSEARARLIAFLRERRRECLACGLNDAEGDAALLEVGLPAPRPPRHGPKTDPRAYPTETALRDRLRAVWAASLRPEAPPLDWQQVAEGLGLGKTAMYKYLGRYNIKMDDIREGKL